MAIGKIVLINSEGWKMEKEFDDLEEYLTTLVNANKKNSRGTEKSVIGFDADDNTITIKVVPKKE